MLGVPFASDEAPMFFFLLFVLSLLVLVLLARFALALCRAAAVLFVVGRCLGVAHALHATRGWGL